MSDPKKKPGGDGSSESRKQQLIPSDLREIDAIDPVTGKKGFKLYIRDRTIDQTARKGEGASKELAYTVPEAAQKPTGIFRGVTEFEEGDETWLIYVYLISGLERLYSNCPLAEYAGFPGDFAFGHHLIGSDMPMSLAV